VANYCLNFTFGTYPARLEILFFAPGDEIVLHLFCEGVGLDIALQTRKHAEINNGPEQLLVAVTDFDRHHSPNFDSAWHGTAMKTRRESNLASTVQDALLAAYILPKNLEQHLLISRVQSNEQIDERGLAIIGASCALHLLNPDCCESPLCAMSICMTEEVYKTNSNVLHFEREVCELLAVVNTHGVVFAELRGVEVKEFECIQYLNMAHDQARNLLDLLSRFCRYFLLEEGKTDPCSVEHIRQTRTNLQPIIQSLSRSLGTDALKWLSDRPLNKSLAPVHFGITTNDGRTSYLNFSLSEVDSQIDSEVLVLGTAEGMDWLYFRAINKSLSPLAFKDALLYGRLVRCNQTHRSTNTELNLGE
jgi:hypothetical protein